MKKIVDNNVVDVRLLSSTIADLLNGEVRVDGSVVPSMGIREAMIDGVSDEDELAQMAVDAAVYRFNKRIVLVVTHKEPVGADQVLYTGYDAAGGMFRVIKRAENIRVRPWMAGVMARFEMEPRDEALYALFGYMRQQDRYPVACVGRKYFFAAKELRDRVFAHFNVEEMIGSNTHVLVRMGVLMKRPGGLMQQLSTPVERFFEKENDGTVMISRKMDGPRPGTLRIHEDDIYYYAKGMVRPPFVVNGCTEQEGLVNEAQFGGTMPTGAQVGEFAAVRTMPSERPSLNYQAVLFGAENPAEVIRADNGRLKRLSVDDVFSVEESRKIRAGVPAALFMRQYAPWKWLKQFEPSKRKARETVYGSALVPMGSVMLLPDTYKRFHSKKHPAPGLLMLHRDPAMPDASSMALYTLEGEIKWQGRDDGTGIVINPGDPRWKAAGGDFDGDAAVVFEPRFALKPRVEQPESLRLGRGVPMVEFQQNAAVEAIMIEMANGVASRLGPSMMNNMRLAEVEQLTEELAALGQQVSQTCVEAQKHAVDANAARSKEKELRDAAKAVMPAQGFLLDEMHKVQQAVGGEAKLAAWRGLTVHAAGRTPETDIEAAMLERIQILDELFRKWQWLRGDRAELPDRLRTAAKQAVLLGEEDPAAAVALVRHYSRLYREAVRAYVELDESDEDARYQAQERIREVRLMVRLAVRQGELSEAAIVAYGPNRVAAELVSGAFFEELGMRSNHLETALFGTHWVDGTYQVSDLDPVPSAAEELTAALAAVEQVQLSVIGDGARHSRVLLRW